MAVDLADLPEEILRRGPGFLLSSIMDSRPHAVHLCFEVAAADGQVELRTRAGRTATGNSRMRPSVTVLFPAAVSSAPGGRASHRPTPDEPLGPHPDHSLIVDGEARIVTIDGNEHLAIGVTSAVWHRPAPRPGPGR